MEEGNVVAWFEDLKKAASGMGFDLRAFHNGGFQLGRDDESVLLDDSLGKIAGFLEGFRFATKDKKK